MTPTAKTPHAKPSSETRERYLEATGGRKTALARARLYAAGEGITVNDKNYAAYFPIAKHQTAILAPIELMKPTRIGRISLRVHGGGVSAQVSAVRNAIAKAIALQAPDAKKRLRRAGFITRDARMVERKKYGLKKARRAPQWQKR